MLIKFLPSHRCGSFHTLCLCSGLFLCYSSFKILEGKPTTLSRTLRSRPVCLSLLSSEAHSSKFGTGGRWTHCIALHRKFLWLASFFAAVCRVRSIKPFFFRVVFCITHGKGTGMFQIILPQSLGRQICAPLQDVLFGSDCLLLQYLGSLKLWFCSQEKTKLLMHHKPSIRSARNAQSQDWLSSIFLQSIFSAWFLTFSVRRPRKTCRLFIQCYPSHKCLYESEGFQNYCYPLHTNYTQIIRIRKDVIPNTKILC